jgi:hypothetical protein
MPFRSRAQQKYMFAAADRGELPKKVAEEFAHKTKNFKKLPERVAKDMNEDKGCEHNAEKMCKACCKSMKKSHEATEMMKALTARMLSQVVRYQDHREKMEAARANETPVIEESIRQPQRAFDPSIPVERVMAPSPRVQTPDPLVDCGTCGLMHKSLVECPRCSQIAKTNAPTLPIWRR